MRRTHLHLAQVPKCAVAALIGVLSFIAEIGHCQLRINEIMYAPVSPEPEWIEIFNPDSTEHELKNWVISTITKTAVFPGCVIPANGYLVCTKDSAALRARRPGTYSILQIALPALKNTGGFVVLRDSTQTTIDSLEYLPSWGGASGSSLERRNVLIPSTAETNWGTTRDTSGATPGRRNSISKPPFDLALDSLLFHFDRDTLLVSMRVTNVGASIMQNARIALASDTGMGYRILATLPIDSLPADTSFVGHWSIPKQPLRATKYEEFINTPKDTLHGNDTIYFVSQTGLEALSIAINEVMFAPVKPEPEWIELLNTSKDTIDVGGLSITVGHGAPQLIPMGARPLAPDSMIVLTNSDSLLAAIRHVTRTNILHFPLPTLSNTGSTLALRDRRNELIDTVAYLGSWIKADGSSIERIDPTRSGTEPSNWGASEDTSGTTILAPNSVRLRNYDLAMKGLLFADTTLILTIVNVGKDTVRNTAVELQGHFSLLERITSPIFPQDSAHLTIPIQSTFYGTDVLTASILDSLDENTANDTLHTTLTLDVPQDSLLINEILYQPATGACEWVELANVSSRTILMGGIRMLTGSKTLYSLILPAFEIPTASMGLVAANSTILTTYPSIGLRPQLAILGRSTLNLSNDSASIVLRNPDGATIDSVRYHSTWQTTLRPDLTGISLERRHWNSPSTDSSNWQSSNDSNGATPLAQNSASQITTAVPSGATFSANFDPNPFSPDGDGFEDESVLKIESGDEIQYALRVRLYDARGRLARTLTDATTMTSAISLTDDGRNDSGQILPPGLYTALIELSSQNPPKLLRKTIGVVIAGRRR